ncbi:hypothetical protein [Geodermatophilus sabuli]|uniref:Uncharacterized protein n=1 Tax=Geodermatophilus sabuli TaxID=1564158 RepID=A0A285ECK1_9ACTN|nr:hypothetical protein [Geodermatophilus sabuli]MBB3083432.1 phage shock protein A [Geodermatophilus sabuli]SNX96848.1 hypothetical protein SAMN06893097_105188 [Geodermatophilus sabuli]
MPDTVTVGGPRRRAAVEARAAEALAARERRLAEFDAAAVEVIERRMANLRAEENEAREQLQAAVKADPVLGAYIRQRAARQAQYHLRHEQANIARRLGQPEPFVPDTLRTTSLADEVTAVVAREANAQAADVIVEHLAGREAVGAGAGEEGTPARTPPAWRCTR